MNRSGVRGLCHGLCKVVGLLLLMVGLPLSSLHAQVPDQMERSIPDSLTLTLEEAVELALVHNYLLEKGLLNLEMADEQIRQAWGTVYPQVGASGSYTRNLKSPNPFAGSDAGGLFDLFGAMEWLNYNETARTDSDGSTAPLTFEEFMDRQEQGMEDAGVTPAGGENPFAIDNQFNFGLSVTQTLFNGAAFAAIRGAEQLKEMNRDEFAAQQQSVVDQIRQLFYGALLAREQTEVLRASVERLKETVRDTQASVEAGILSNYESLSAEVELVNLETELISSENRAEMAVLQLGLTIGIPVETELTLRGTLDVDGTAATTLQEPAYDLELALNRRPDLQQMNGYIELLGIQKKVERARYFPTVQAFLNTAYIGQVPTNRERVWSDPETPFSFRTETRGFFDDSYWDSALAVGIQLQWSLFDGFQRHSRMQQRSIEIKQAQIDREQLRNGIQLEVDQVRREIETAWQRIRSQERNLERANLNYEQARRRLTEGVGTALEERQASSLLDQSRLAWLSAAHDLLVAKSRYDRITGQPVLTY
ncbi:MAG: TolC family protein [Balneolaceae bacterium]